MQFNFVATYYDVLSRIVFGGVLDKAKVALFDRIKNGDKVLFIGGGAGNSLKRLLELKPELKIDFVDSSNKMTLKASKGVDLNSTVCFYAMPIENFEGVNYDVIITEFFFDLFNQNKCEELMVFIAPKLNKHGVWIDTDFRNTSNRRHYLLLKLMYLFFRVMAQVSNSNLYNNSLLFKSRGFRLKKNLRFKEGFISSCLYVRH